ncbi:MAG: hypothetical protein JOZ31_01005 [Verrucomicrobia bacterium]|nr:hypothetical protein [Verrucomicrobiota bacterium]
MKLVITVIMSVAFSFGAWANQCTKYSDDAGRWRDPLKPSDRIKYLCDRKVPKWVAKQGVMVITNMNQADCDAAVQFAQDAESWHFDWFLWNRIGCEGGMVIEIL